MAARNNLRLAIIDVNGLKKGLASKWKDATEVETTVRTGLVASEYVTEKRSGNNPHFWAVYDLLVDHDSTISLKLYDTEYLIVKLQRKNLGDISFRVGDVVSLYNATHEQTWVKRFIKLGNNLSIIPRVVTFILSTDLTIPLESFRENLRNAWGAKLPRGWEMRTDEAGRLDYMDIRVGKSTPLDPRRFNAPHDIAVSQQRRQPHPASIPSQAKAVQTIQRGAASEARRIPTPYSQASNPSQANIHNPATTRGHVEQSMVSGGVYHAANTGPSLSTMLDRHRLNAQFQRDCTVEQFLSPARGQTERRIWKRARYLGGGTFGQVWQEKWEDGRGDWQYRAVKVCAMNSSSVDFKRELAALVAFSTSQHSGLFVNLHGWWMDDIPRLFVAMDFHRHGDLSNFISQGITEAEAKEITTDVLRGLSVMHQQRFAHRDIKPQNILVVQKRPEARKWWVKIGDFGISKRVNENAGTDLHTSVGTPHYSAPEVFGYYRTEEHYSYTSKVDLWSIGCVIFNITSKGQQAFSHLAELHQYCSGAHYLNHHHLPLNISPVGWTFLQALLQPDPRLRPTADEALRHPWYQSPSLTTDRVPQAAAPTASSKSASRIDNRKQTTHRPHPYNSFLSDTYTM